METYPIYEGNDLGCQYSPKQTTLKVWAPTADKLECHLMKSHEESLYQMQKEADGVWSLTLEGDFEGFSYVYRATFGDKVNEATDPYARASTVNHERTVIVDLGKTEVPYDGSALKPLDHYTDAVVYELHVRDFSMDDASGIKNRGKFLGLMEEGLRGPEGQLRGVDYLADLGVTHIQLLPVYDFGSVDEKNQFESYNWGYDPVQYNVPEGSYGSSIEDPYARIIELKKAIDHLHSRGLRVIMDVVYNHMFDKDASAFERLVPGYYFRQDEEGNISNGSFCGNDIDSTKPMMRKYLMESTRIWIEEFGFDGFRFDLMGILDIDTMNAIADQTLAIRPDAMIYGEGWNMPTFLDDSLKATMMNHEQMPKIAHFSDIFREAMKGGTMEDKFDDGGYGSGAFEKAAEAAHLLMGTTNQLEHGELVLEPYFTEPHQTINYVECHDNHTLWDKLKMSLPEEDEKLLKQRHRFITSLVLISQGVPFLHAGQEFFRTKNNDHNSYKSSDEINMLRWEQKDANQANVDYIKALIELRKAYPELRLRTSEEISKRVQMTLNEDHTISYHIEAANKGYKALTLLINPHVGPVVMPIEAKGEIIFNANGKASMDYESHQLTVEPLSITVIKEL